VDNALAAAPALTAKTLLAHLNARLALLRTWLSHDHRDEPYWWARRTTAPRVQVERLHLRWIANLLHIERVTARGRRHGTQFADLDAQREWLAEHAAYRWPELGGATLIALREGTVSL